VGRRGVLVVGSVAYLIRWWIVLVEAQCALVEPAEREPGRLLADRHDLLLLIAALALPLPLSWCLRLIAAQRL
jgi:hypothetical protein